MLLTQERSHGGPTANPANCYFDAPLHNRLTCSKFGGRAMQTGKHETEKKLHELALGRSSVVSVIYL